MHWDIIYCLCVDGLLAHYSLGFNSQHARIVLRSCQTFNQHLNPTEETRWAGSKRLGCPNEGINKTSFNVFFSSPSKTQYRQLALISDDRKIAIAGDRIIVNY